MGLYVCLRACFRPCLFGQTKGAWRRKAGHGAMPQTYTFQLVVTDWRPPLEHASAHTLWDQCESEHPSHSFAATQTPSQQSPGNLLAHYTTLAPRMVSFTVTVFLTARALHSLLCPSQMCRATNFPPWMSLARWLLLLFWLGTKPKGFTSVCYPG